MSTVEEREAFEAQKGRKRQMKAARKLARVELRMPIAGLVSLVALARKRSLANRSAPEPPNGDSC